METDMTTIRVRAEEAHHDRLMKELAGPTSFYIENSHPGAEVIDVRIPNGMEHSKKSLDQLTADDFRGFCWKDCAVYLTNDVRALDHLRIFDFTYREWFPYRAQSQDIGLGNFFCKFMRFSQHQSLENIVAFHTRLCTHIKRNQDQIKVQTRGQYDVRSALYNVFITIDSTWREDGVLIVCKDEETARQLGFQEEQRYNQSDSGNMGDSVVFKAPIARAMKAIVFQDEERREDRSGGSDFYKARCGFYRQFYGTSDI